MEYRKLGRTGLKVSEICFGTATFGGHADPEESERMLDTFLEEGSNFIDTVDRYSAWIPGSSVGRSEEIIGSWIKSSGKRHRIVLATKCRGAMGPLPNDQGLSRRHIMDVVEASLKRLNTDFIDLYQTHGMGIETPIEETMRALDALVHQGKVYATLDVRTIAPGASVRPFGLAIKTTLHATNVFNLNTACSKGKSSSGRRPNWWARRVWP